MSTTPNTEASLPTGSPDRLERLKAFLKVDPTNEALARDCIALALECGDHDLALEQTERLLTRSPDDMALRFARATALIAKRDYAQAIATLRGVVATDHSLWAAWINLGLCHYCLNEFPQAREALETAYSSGDRSAGLLRLLVSTYHHLGLMDQAVSIADTNRAPANGDSALAGVYALVYLDVSQSAQAARWAAKALAGNPDSVDGLTVQATLNAAKMHVAHAREQYERALQLAPSNGRAWVGLGALALFARDLPRATSLLTRGVEQMPRHVGSWHVLGWAHLLSGELNAAESVFQRTLELDRNFSETHGGLAAVAALRGDVRAAEQGIEVALRLDPKCLSAQFARSVLVSRSGDAPAGRKLIRDTLSGLSPGDGSLLARVIEDAAQR